MGIVGTVRTTSGAPTPRMPPSFPGPKNMRNKERDDDDAEDDRLVVPDGGFLATRGVP